LGEVAIGLCAGGCARTTASRLPEMPGIFSQSDSFDDLEENVRDAYELVEDEALGRPVPLALE